HDNVTPASNSVMAQVLFQLGRYYANNNYQETVLNMLRILSGSILKYGWYHAGWARLICDFVFPSFEVAIAGPDAREKVTELESQYLPHILICGSATESFLPLLEQRYKPGETWLYVCRDNTCNLPVNKVEIVIDQVTKSHIS
ncbi:MAG TPA: hypothetical protein VHO90_00680, partial [Bacteroidales bacterium]|nr:hypothetical protein [Bacteroidales bacterium]